MPGTRFSTGRTEKDLCGSAWYLGCTGSSALESQAPGNLGGSLSG